MNKEKEIQEFKAYLIEEAKSKNTDPNQYVQELSKDENKMKEAYQRFQEYKRKKTQKAAHGAKLQYFKTLKHQCAEDEELVYYKREGSVDCDCVKKHETGGKVEQKEADWKTKFKTRKASSGMAAPAEKKTLAKYQNNKINPSDTVHVDGKVYSLTSMNGEKAVKQFPAYIGSKAHKKDEANAKKGNKDAQRRLNKQDEITAPKNGAKLAKKNCGGSFMKKSRIIVSSKGGK